MIAPEQPIQADFDVLRARSVPQTADRCQYFTSENEAESPLTARCRWRIIDNGFGTLNNAWHSEGCDVLQDVPIRESA